jgi:hypothetical protein
MHQQTADRLFPVLLALLIAAGAFFGLAPFLVPAQFASSFGFHGVDILMYRLAGAATFGYGVGLALGYRASWPVTVGTTATLLHHGGPSPAAVTPASAK